MWFNQTICVSIYILTDSSGSLSSSAYRGWGTAPALAGSSGLSLSARSVGVGSAQTAAAPSAITATATAVSSKSGDPTGWAAGRSLPGSAAAILGPIQRPAGSFGAASCFAAARWSIPWVVAFASPFGPFGWAVGVVEAGIGLGLRALAAVFGLIGLWHESAMGQYSPLH